MGIVRKGADVAKASVTKAQQQPRINHEAEEPKPEVKYSLEDLVDVCVEAAIRKEFNVKKVLDRYSQKGGRRGKSISN